MWPKRKKGKSRGTKSKLKALKPDGSSDDADDNGTEPETQPFPEPIPYAQEPPQVTASNSQEDLISGVWKSKVLNNYKKNPKDSHNLLARIPTGKAAFEAGERQKEELIKESMTRIVDRMFDNFQNTAYEFNQVTGGSDLELTWTRPSFAREDTSAWHETSKSINDVFAGRISTRFWTLAVRGTTQSIGVFILPADKLLAFTTVPNQFATYCHMRPVCDGMNVTWLIDGREIEQDLLPSVYRALLDGLIRFANEEAVPNEQFSLHDIGIVPEPPPPSTSFVQSTQFSSSAQHSTQGLSASAQFSTGAGEFSSEFSQASPQGDLLGQEPERRGRPVDGFINDISSQVALEAQSEADKIRESIAQAQVMAQAQQAQAQMSASSSFSTGQLDSGFANRNVSGQHGNTDTDWRSVSNNKGADWRQFMESTKEQIAPQADDDKWNAVPGTQKLLAGQTSDSLSRVSSGSYTTGSAGATYQNQPAQPFQQPPMQQMPQQPVMPHPMYADPNQNVLAHMESEQPPQLPQQSPNSTIPNLVPPPGYEPLPAHVLQNMPSSTQSGMQPGTPPPNGSQPGMPNHGMQPNMAQNGMQPSGMQPGMTHNGMQPGMQPGMQFPGTTQSGMQPGMQYPGVANNGMPPNQMPPAMQPNQVPPAMQPSQVPPAMQYPGMTHNGMQPGMPPGMQQGLPPTLPGMTPSGMQPGMNHGLPPTLPGMTHSGMQPGMNQGLPPTLPGMTPSGMQPGMQLPGMQPGKLPGLQPGLQPGMQPNQTYSGTGMPLQMMPSTPQQTEPVSRQNLHSGPYGSVSGRPIHDPRAFQPPEPAPEEHVPYLLSESDFDEKQQKQYPYEVEQPQQSANQAPQNQYEEQARQLLEQHQDQHNLKFGQEPEYQSYEEFQQAQQDPTVGEPTDQAREQEQAEPIDEDQSEHAQEQYEQQAEQYERQIEEYEQQVQEEVEQEAEQPAEEEAEQPAGEEAEQPAGEEPEQPAGEDPEQPAEQEPEQPAEEERQQPEEEQPAEQSHQPAEESAEETGESEELPAQHVEAGTGADGGFPEKSYTELPAVTPMAPKPVTFEMPLPNAAKLVAAKAQQIGAGYDVDPDLYDAVSVVLATIDNQIERLTKQGTAAFASRDFRQAESIIKLSERLTAFKQEAEELIKQLSVKEE